MTRFFYGNGTSSVSLLAMAAHTRVFSPAQVGVATLLGGAGAGLLLVAANASSSPRRIVTALAAAAVFFVGVCIGGIEMGPLDGVMVGLPVAAVLVAVAYVARSAKLGPRPTRRWTEALVWSTPFLVVHILLSQWLLPPGPVPQ